MVQTQIPHDLIVLILILHRKRLTSNNNNSNNSHLWRPSKCPMMTVITRMIAIGIVNRRCGTASEGGIWMENGRGNESENGIVSLERTQDFPR